VPCDAGAALQAARQQTKDATICQARRLRSANPDLPVLGVEMDPERVDKAQIYSDEHTFFRIGGFNFPLQSWVDGTPETVRLIRAFNDLRQYAEGMGAGACERLSSTVFPVAGLSKAPQIPLAASGRQI
jgi:hypothetical protein